jgi:hypothetical protein
MSRNRAFRVVAVDAVHLLIFDQNADAIAQ